MKIRTSRQHYSCIQCGRCCRRHDVVVYPEEQSLLDRLEIAGAERPYTERIGGLELLRMHSDVRKGCMFLAEDQTCMIHRKYGYAGKFLSCRAHPLNIFPTFAGEVGVMACFSCPGVMGETGRLLEEQRSMIGGLTEALHLSGEGYGVGQCCGLEKPAVLEIVEVWHRLLERPGEDFRRNLLACSVFMAKISGLGAGLLNDGEVRKEVLEGLLEPGRLTLPREGVAAPGAFQRMLFRSWLLAFVRREGESCDRGLSFRLHQFCRTIGFVLGRGDWHAFGQEHPSGEFRNAGLFSGSNAGAWPMPVWSSCRRYLLARLESLLFFGPAYYGVSLREGFTALLGSVLAIRACALYHQAARHASVPESQDVEYGVASVDYCFGRSPFLGMKMHRNTERLLFGENFSRFLFHL